MENNRAIYPCICTLSINTDKMYIALENDVYFQIPYIGK